MMTMVSVIGGFTPTLFFEAYAKLEVTPLNQGSLSIGAQMFCGECTYIPDTNPLSIGCESCHYKARNLAKESLYSDYTRHLAITCAVLLPSSYLCGLALTHWWDHERAKSTANEEEHTSRPRSRPSIERSIDLGERMPALLKEGIHGKEGWTIFECSIALVITRVRARLVISRVRARVGYSHNHDSRFCEFYTARAYANKPLCRVSASDWRMESRMSRPTLPL